MPQNSKRNSRIALAIIIAVVIYGSLYPFAFDFSIKGIGPIQKLLNTGDAAFGRADFLSNLVFYLPVGFFFIGATDPRLGTAWRVVLVTLLGLILSTGCEIIQYYDGGRVTSAADVVSDVFGVLLGAAGGMLFGENFRWSFPRQMRSQPLPMMFLVAWLGYRLYPYVPTASVHKYWDALKPLFLQPHVMPFEVFRYAVMWLTVAGLIEAISGQKRSRRLVPQLAGCVLLAKVMIISRVVSPDEIVGAAVGYCLWLAILGQDTRVRAGVVLGSLFAYVLMWRLEPFTFGVPTRPFGWVPFYGLMRGSTDVDVQSFLEKFFYYGSLVWFGMQAGLQLRVSAVIVAIFIFATSSAEIYLPDRSAETTDAVLTLIIAYFAALLSPPQTNGVTGATARAAS